MRWISLAVRSGVGFKQVVSCGGLACLGLCWTGLRRLDVRQTSWIGPMHVLFRLDFFLMSCLLMFIMFDDLDRLMIYASTVFILHDRSYLFKHVICTEHSAITLYMLSTLFCRMSYKPVGRRLRSCMSS